ncbi:MAG TPA: Mpo1-like protein [Dokdonella sp.]
MRSVQDWFDSYGGDHQHPTNRLIHWICVPAILWSVIAALWLLPVSPRFGRPGFWCGLAMAAAFAFYWRLSRPLGAAMLVAFVLLGLLTEGLYRTLGPQGLGWLAIAVFVLAWIGQFAGHRIEGRRPTFLTDLAYLLIGPAWLAAKVLRRIGIAY